MGRVAKAFVGWGIEVDMSWFDYTSLNGKYSLHQYDYDGYDIVHLTGGVDGDESHFLCWRSSVVECDEFDKSTPLNDGDSVDMIDHDEWHSCATPILEALDLDESPDPQWLLIVQNI